MSGMLNVWNRKWARSWAVFISNGLMLLALLTVQPLFAAPYLGAKMKLKQPDGSRVEVLVWGDEYYQRIESIDGYTLIRNAQNWIYYAKLNAAGDEFLPTSLIYRGRSLPEELARRAPALAPDIPLQKHLELKPEAILRQRQENERRYKSQSGARSSGEAQTFAAAPYVVTGAVRGLTLVIDFSDEPATVPQAEIEQFFNARGYAGFGNNGSIRDYFYDVSGGLLDYTNHVTAYYRALRPKTYYDDAENYRTPELIQEALNYLAGTGFDFTTLSLGSDNEIRALNVFYAGNPDQGWAKGLWPHASSMYYEVGGVHTDRYQITNIGAELSLRTTCHENGHMLMHWADLYDYGYESTGVGSYDLMGYGASDFNPVPPNPYFRWLAGWEQPVVLQNAGEVVTLNLAANSRTTYRINNPNKPEEVFIIEAIDQGGTDRWQYMPDEGLLVWHIDETGSNDYQQMTPDMHYMVSVEQADGLFELEGNLNYGGPGDLYHAGNGKAFRPTTVPNSNWWNGSASNLNIWNVSAVAPMMSFNFQMGGGLGDIRCAVTHSNIWDFGYQLDVTVTNNGVQPINWWEALLLRRPLNSA